MRYFLTIAVFMSLTFYSCEEPTIQEQKPAASSDLDSLNQMVAFIRANPLDPKGYFDKAQFLVNGKKFESAIEEIERGVRADSTFAPLHLLRGQMAMELRDVENAYLSFAKCVAVDSTAFECHMNLAELEIGLGNIKEARALLNTVLRQDMYQGRAYAIRGYMYSQLRDTTLAISSYQTAVEVNTEDYDSFIALGLLYLGQMNDLAIDAFDSAIEMEPSSTEALYAKAYFLQTSARGDSTRLYDALELYSTINTIDPNNSPAHYNQGYIYLEFLNQFQNAETKFTQAIEVYPKYYQAYFNRGLARHSLQKLEQALSDYDKTLDLQPDFTPAAQMKEQVLRDMGRI